MRGAGTRFSFYLMPALESFSTDGVTHSSASRVSRDPMGYPDSGAAGYKPGEDSNPQPVPNIADIFGSSARVRWATLGLRGTGSQRRQNFRHCRYTRERRCSERHEFRLSDRPLKIHWRSSAFLFRGAGSMAGPSIFSLPTPYKEGRRIPGKSADYIRLSALAGRHSGQEYHGCGASGTLATA